MGNEKRRSRSFWLSHVRAASVSEQTIAAYAQAHEVSADMLYRWRSQLRREGVLESKVKGAEASDFVRADVATSGGSRSTLIVTFANGCRVEVACGSDSATLTAVLRGVAAL